MDPLSVAASIAGLLTASHQVSSAVGSIISSRRHGAKDAKKIKTTVDTLRSVLQQLQLLLLNQATIDARRASLILVDEIVATLTACVLTFSDLDDCVKELKFDREIGLLDSVRWASRAPELRGHLVALESHKTALCLVISVLTCKSSQYAENAADELKILMLQVLQSNHDLAERMSRLEKSSMSSRTNDDNDAESLISQETVLPLASRSADQQDGEFDGPAHFPTFVFTFEEDLHTSWVYRRSKQRGPETYSITSSTCLTQSWSMLSGLSLSNVSNIAVQALPIYEEDLLNSDVYWFGYTRDSMSPQNLWQNFSSRHEDERRVRELLALQRDMLGTNPCPVSFNLDIWKTQSADAQRIPQTPFM